MTLTALHDAQAAAVARFAEYRGAETAAEFSGYGVAAEFAALGSGCGIFDLGWRAKLVVAGEDRLRWLNGMVTNNIKDLPSHHGKYAFLLNAQGRIQGDMYIYNRGDHALVDTDLSQREKISGIFEKYIIMDDVQLSDAGDRITAVGVHGPKTSAILKAAEIDLDPETLPLLELRDFRWRGNSVSLARVGDEKNSHFEIWGDPPTAADLWTTLLAAGATPVGSDALELWRIASGIPRYGQDIRDRDLPQETEQMQALDFRKGCYLGQEIVERIRSRGILHRKFTGFVLSGALPASGAQIDVQGKKVGEITSVASLPSSNGTKNVALGYIRRDAGMPGAEVSVSGIPARVVNLPFQTKQH
jgi:folate-binding protein YgfZ